MSVIIPAYNPGPLLRPALASVVDQTFGDFECVVVDDGSQEDLAWVEDFDPRIRLERQQNQGPTAARNQGVRTSDAPLVAFLDQDDAWEPDKLMQQVSVIDATGADLISTGFVFVDDRGQVTGVGYQSASRTHLDLLRGNGICTSSVLTRRSVLDSIGLFNTTVLAASDWDAWLRIASLGKELVHIDQRLVRYRQHGENMSLNYSASYRASMAVLRSQFRAGVRRRDVLVVWNALRGMRRMGELFGRQAYDAFRRRRGFPDIAYAALLSPGYTLGATARKLIHKTGSGRSRRQDNGPGHGARGGV